MNSFNKKSVLLISALFFTLPAFSSNGQDDVSLNTSTSTPISDDNKHVIASFSDNLFIIPCVEVKGSGFNGHYHVVLGKSGDDNGSHWNVKDAKLTSADDCGHHTSASDTASTDDRLRRLGLPSVDDLSKH